jgi:hypothetical protein
MQRRTHATFERELQRLWLQRPDLQAAAMPEILSFAPFVPGVQAANAPGRSQAIGHAQGGPAPPQGAASDLPCLGLDYIAELQNPQLQPLWPLGRFTSLMLGEIPRLRPNGYGPQGSDFIMHVHVPPLVEAAYSRLLAASGAGKGAIGSLLSVRAAWQDHPAPRIGEKR